MFEATISVKITSMRPKNTLVTDRILDATLPNTLIVLVEYTSFCRNFSFAVRNYIILWSCEHPFGDSSDRGAYAASSLLLYLHSSKACTNEPN